jgi:hypothetical protein
MNRYKFSYYGMTIASYLAAGYAGMSFERIISSAARGERLENILLGDGVICALSIAVSWATHKASKKFEKMPEDYLHKKNKTS